mmetsp:Transcript_36512/g.97238  ORF Transcript_36512/g.97238 Transcript_36512/m.97238 type:complete len:318 (-) Transcript_36512:745-1698(-)
MFVVAKMASARKHLSSYFREEMSAVRDLRDDVIKACTPTSPEEKMRKKKEQRARSKRARALIRLHLQQVRVRGTPAPKHRDVSGAGTKEKKLMKKKQHGQVPGKICGDTVEDEDRLLTADGVRTKEGTFMGARSTKEFVHVHHTSHVVDVSAERTPRGAAMTVASDLKCTASGAAHSVGCCAGIARVRDRLLEMTAVDITALQAFCAEVIQACTPSAHTEVEKTAKEGRKKRRRQVGGIVDAQHAVAVGSSWCPRLNIERSLQKEMRLWQERGMDVESTASSSTEASDRVVTATRRSSLMAESSCDSDDDGLRHHSA